MKARACTHSKLRSSLFDQVKEFLHIRKVVAEGGRHFGDAIGSHEDDVIVRVRLFQLQQCFGCLWFGIKFVDSQIAVPLAICRISCLDFATSPTFL